MRCWCTRRCRARSTNCGGCRCRARHGSWASTCESGRMVACSPSTPMGVTSRSWSRAKPPGPRSSSSNSFWRGRPRAGSVARAARGARRPPRAGPVRACARGQPDDAGEDRTRAATVCRPTALARRHHRLRQCHDPARAFTKPEAVSPGVFGRRGRRNAPTVLNRAWGRDVLLGRARRDARGSGAQADRRSERDGPAARGGVASRGSGARRHRARPRHLHPLADVGRLPVRPLRERRSAGTLAGSTEWTAAVPRAW